MRKAKIKVIFDFDSTIWNSVKAVVDTVISEKYYEIKAGLFPMPLAEWVHTWSFSCELPSMSKHEIDKVFHNPTFFKLLTPIVDPSGFSMAELVEELCSDSRFDVHICSLGVDENLRLKREFIKERMPYVKTENIHLLKFDKNKSMDKSIMSGDIIVDDSAKVIKSVPHIPNRILFCNHGERVEWNAEMFDHKEKGFYRADSVSEVSMIINNLFCK